MPKFDFRRTKPDTTMPDLTRAECGCPDFTSTRRTFLRNVATVSAGAVTTTMFGQTFRQAAYGATNSNVLVVLSLRGGADFLSMVVPYTDQAYYAARPHIAVPQSTLICQDNTFGLHPAFAPLQSMWTGRQMGVVLATGLPAPNRSHFEAIVEVEDADPGSDLRSGWINRLIGLDVSRSPLDGIQLGSGLLPTSLTGPASAIASATTDDISLSGGDDDDARARRRQALTQLWRQETGPLAVGVCDSLKTTATLAPMLSHEYAPSSGASYPDGDLGDALKDSARLIKANVGVEVITLDYGTWDMHSNVGDLDSEGTLSMKGMVTGLASALAAFFTDLGSLTDRVTLVTMTEFGRRVAENGSRGLDHGWANSTLVLGGGVNGGQYVGTWPGLDGGNLNDGDLAVTTDYRDVLAEIITKRFGVSTSSIFPGFSPAAVGIMASSAVPGRLRQSPRSRLAKTR